MMANALPDFGRSIYDNEINQDRKIKDSLVWQQIFTHTHLIIRKPITSVQFHNGSPEVSKFRQDILDELKK